MNCIFYIKTKQGLLFIYNHDGKETVLNKKLLKYLNNLCLSFGGNYEGRIASYRHLTSWIQKPIVYVNDDHVFLPTRAIKNESCILLNVMFIKSIYKIDDNVTAIIFINDLEIHIFENYRVIKKQYQRAKVFLDKLYWNSKYYEYF